MSRTVAILLVAGGVLLFMSLPLWVNPGLVYLAGVTLATGVFAVAWNIPFGYAGLASFGSGGLFAIGAYVMAISLRAGYGASFLPLILLAALVGGLIAFAIGATALRRSSGIYFAILTLALAEVLRHFLMRWHWVGAEDGLPNIARPTLSLLVAEIDLSVGDRYYFFLLAACALIVALAWWIVNGHFGRTLRAIKHDPERAAFMGVDVFRYKLLAFTISGALTAAAGALYAPWAQIVTPEVGNMMRSTQPILFTLLGGASSFWGPLIGAVMFSAIEYGTRTLAGLQEIITGGVLLFVILLFPTGVSGAFRRLVAAFEGRAARQPAEKASAIGEPAPQRS